MSAQGLNGQSQSLYRKYRPTTFAEDELVGQDHIARTLRNAVRYDRVAHAYLFCGPRGTGKTSTARLLAKAVNCEAIDPADRPCNACPSCKAINEGRATDIIEIDAASNRGIEDIRDLREKVRFSPAQLKKKFYIIDEVHQLTKDACNALLKTLEEPPPHAAFILATTDPEKVLDTISSRCQTFVFHRFPVEQIARHLRRVCTLEGITADDAALTAIARAATGAMRDALGLLDQLSAFGSSDERITAEIVRQMIGAGGSEQVLALIDAVAAGDAAAGLRVINAVVDSGADARSFTAQLVEYLRALLHAAATPARGGRAPSADTPVAPEHLDAFSLGEIATLVKRFSQVDYGLRHSVHGHLPLELCLVDAVLARTGAAAETPAPLPARPIAPPRPLPGRGEGRGARGEGGDSQGEARTPEPERVPTPIRPETRVPVPIEAAPPPQPVASLPTPPPPPAAPTPSPAPLSAAPAAPEIGIEQVHDLWPRIRQGVRASNRRIEALLASADPFTVANGTLTLVAAYEFHRNGLNKDDARQVVEEVLEQVLGAPYHLHCISQDEARGLPAPVSRAAADNPPPSPPRPAKVPEPAPIAETAPALAPEPVPIATPDAPPWDDDAAPPALDPAPDAEAAPRPRALSEATVAGSWPGQAMRAADQPAPPTADDRYLNAVRNIFNAFEIKV